MLGHRALGCAASLALAVPLALAGPAAVGEASLQKKANDASSATAVLFEWDRIAIATVYPAPPAAATPIPVGTLYLGFASLAVNDAVQTDCKECGGWRHCHCRRGKSGQRLADPKSRRGDCGRGSCNRRQNEGHSLGKRNRYAKDAEGQVKPERNQREATQPMDQHQAGKPPS